jgi:TonB-linked SusC/RagA family outer membrane protein
MRRSHPSLPRSRAHSFARAVFAGLALAAVPAIAHAQRANITGRVTAASTGENLADVRVTVVGTSVSAATAADGRFTLRNVPSGAREVRVLRVGFQEQKKSVAVPADGGVALDFVMAQAIVQLQEIVTTATGQQRRVEIGNAVTTLGDIGEKVEQAPVTNLADLMVAKAPGVTVLPGAMTGATAVVKIRGLNSLSLNNDPIYVIDGVRMNTGSVSQGFTGTRTSYLNDLSPNEIEDIEIVKGPSAATLYGTDAANGVIVITTKKGKAGTAKWTWFGETGTVDDRNDYSGTYAMWGHDPATNKLKRCVNETIGLGQCTLDSTTSVNIMRDPATTPLGLGRTGEVGANVSGGSDAVRFFVSGDVRNETGPLRMPGFAMTTLDSMGTAIRDDWMHPEAFQNESFRANLNASVSPTFDLSVNAGWTNRNQRLPQVDNNIYSVYYSAYNNPGFNYKSTVSGLSYNPIGSLGENRNGYGVYSPAQIFQYVPHEGVQRFIGSGDAQWRPFTWMVNSGTVGLDHASRNDTRLCHFGECPNSGTLRQGLVRDNQAGDRNFSAKIVSTSSYSARSWAQLKTTVGADYNNLESEFVNASGDQLPPGAQTVGQAAIQGASSQFQTVDKTLGLYAQEEAAIRDRMFLTVAARTDQNSAFGTNFQRIVYPKASVSWILSDESFFPRYDFLNQFRLRLAYGASGVQPGATTALQTFGAETNNLSITTPGGASGTDTPGLIANRLGNPDLKPEKSAEFEGGFETRIFDRVNLDFTYYNKKTHDALIAQPIAASSGASSLTITRNLGSVQNTGLEATVNATLIDRRSFAWDLVVGASHNTNKIVSLGLDPNGDPNPTIGTGSTRDSLGLPVLGFFARPYTFADKDGNGFITPDEVTVASGFEYMGYSQPRDIVTIQNGIDLFGRKLHLQALVDYKGGFVLYNNTISFYCQQFLTCYDETHTNVSLDKQARIVALRYKNPSTNQGFLENGQFWKLREVSATISLPQRLAGAMRARDVSLLLAGRNLHTWTAYTGIDPESNYGTGDVQTDFSTTAPRTYFIARLNLHY